MRKNKTKSTWLTQGRINNKLYDFKYVSRNHFNLIEKHRKNKISWRDTALIHKTLLPYYLKPNLKYGIT